MPRSSGGPARTRALLFRLDFDVLPFKPTVVTTCYGMNDGRYTALTDDIANTYRKNQTGIVESLKAHGVRVIILGSPKPVDLYTFKKPDTSAEIYNKNLGALADIDKEIAAKEGVIYCDVFGAFTAAAAKAKAQYGPTYNMGGDGVHPGPDGHLVMAYAFLKSLGCDGAIGTITVDFAANKAQGTTGHEIVSCQNGTVTVKSTRYPFCFDGRPDSPDATPAAMLKNVPFNEDLNRYMLVVKGLTTPKTKITWGDVSKEFNSSDLDKGINLAAEFLANPFYKQFMIVDHAVHTQEDDEQLLTQEYLFPMPRFKAMAPGADAAFDQATQAAMAHRNTLFQNAAALVVPIQHVIKIEPVR
jgi:lysophospholipase L1-like esterase